MDTDGEGFNPRGLGVYINIYTVDVGDTYDVRPINAFDWNGNGLGSKLIQGVYSQGKAWYQQDPG